MSTSEPLSWINMGVIMMMMTIRGLCVRFLSDEYDEDNFHCDDNDDDDNGDDDACVCFV